MDEHTRRGQTKIIQTFSRMACLKNLGSQMRRKETMTQTGNKNQWV